MRPSTVSSYALILSIRRLKQVDGFRILSSARFRGTDNASMCDKKLGESQPSLRHLLPHVQLREKPTLGGEVPVLLLNLELLLTSKLRL